MFEFKEVRRNIPDDELLEDVKEVADKIGKTSVTLEEYSDHGEFSSATLVRRFGSWHTVLEKCGLPQNRTPMNIPNEELFSNLAEVWTKLGKQPTSKNLSKEVSKFSAGTYEKRFGSWNKALRSFIDFINNEDIEFPELKDKSSLNKSSRRTPRNINWRLRAKVLIKDNCICQMCGTSPAKDPDVILHVDHIKPWSKGGETVEDNLRTLCHKCNIGKSDMEIPQG